MGVIGRWNSWKKKCSLYQNLSNSSLGKSMEIRLLRATVNISGKRSYICQGTLRGFASNFNKSPNTSPAVKWPLLEKQE